MRTSLPPRRPITALALLLSACGPSGPKGGDPSADTGSAAPDDSGDPDPDDSASSAPRLSALEGLGALNLIVVHTDTLRADHMGLYGYDRDTSPSASAAGPLVVLGYHGAASWTLPGTASALSGQWPEHHGRTGLGTPPDDATLDTLTQQLRAAGYATGLFSGSQLIASDAQLRQGFDERLDVPDLHDTETQAMASLVVHATEWVETIPEDQPFFLWFQPMDTHTPYRPQLPFRGTWADYDALPFSLAADSDEQERAYTDAWSAATSDAERQALEQNVRAVYDELVLQQDAGVGALLDWLAETGRAERTLVVLSSDHGETISDDGGATLAHGRSLRPELIGLPLALINPALPAEAVSCLSSNVDLAPTLLRALGLPDMVAVDGQPLQEGCRDVVFSSTYLLEEGTEEPIWMLSASDPRYKLDWDCIEARGALYDTSVDPHALSPIDPSGAPESAGLHDALVAYLADAQLIRPDLRCPVAQR